MVQTYLYNEDLGVDHIGIEAVKPEAYRIDKEVTQAVLNSERRVANRNYEYGDGLQTWPTRRVEQ